MDNKILDGLIDNSRSAMYAAIEVHNKPIFPYRYEVCSILVINSWELILKAYIQINHPEIKIIDKDGLSKPFDDCIDFVLSKIGPDFRTTYENLKHLYEYRCRIIHYYEARIDIILFSLLSKNAVLFYEFLLKHFKIDISEDTNLHLMPIGFRRPVSPIDFISNTSEVAKTSEHVQAFIKSMVDSIHSMDKEGIEDSFLLTYKMSVLNENRIKNADIVAAITKNSSDATISVDNVLGKIELTDDEGVKKVKVEEESLYEKLYTETYNDVIKKCRVMFSDFSKNAKFNKIMKGLKGNPNFHKYRFLDVKRQSGGTKDYYTINVYDELSKHFKAQ
ncbi:MAG: DUF3644 domain-containing protein [Cyclobacteriaceae bacterium]|nr:DUF3644 domain-containing protein [Cyclobacteriaceae bacterium]